MPNSPPSHFHRNRPRKMKSTRRPKSIIFSICFIIFLCVLASLNQVRFDILMSFGQCAFGNYQFDASTISSLNTTNDAEIRILITILTLPDQYQKRHFLRLVYGVQQPLLADARVDVKFVFCNLTKEDQRTLVALEIMRYDDIVILDCEENMNKGKTYTLFKSLPEMFKINDTSSNDPGRHPPYHYVMKADDDIYIRLNSLLDSVRPLPREDLYYGYVIPCESMDPFQRNYMAGMGYMLSWDIVEWIGESELAKSLLVGPEDQVLGRWMRDGQRGKNRFNAKWAMYNFPGTEPMKCSHEFRPDTIAVHLLKNQERWIQTLNYFNVTSNLKPSKLYHI